VVSPTPPYRDPQKKCRHHGDGILFFLAFPKKILPRRKMIDLGKCGALQETFTDAAQMHTCHGCQRKIHSSLVCSSKCPKVDEHEEDNWCSEECLQENWSYGGKKPTMSYGVKKETLLEGGRSAVGSSSGEMIHGYGHGYVCTHTRLNFDFQLSDNFHLRWYN
jgi:hypothetical protein